MMRSKYLNWITLFILAYAIIGFWGYYDVGSFASKHIAILLSVALCLQGIAFTDFKNILKEAEFYFIMVILVISGFCMYLNHSSPGAILLVFNLCAIWYLSDRWKWSRGQIATFTSLLFLLFIKWMLFPYYQNFNTNVIGTGTLLMTWGLITALEYFERNERRKIILQIALVLICLFQLFRTRGRGSMIAMFFWCLIHFAIPKKWKENTKLYPFVYVMIHIATIVFVTAYTAANLFDVPPTVPIFGKRIFSGREIVWYGLWQASQGKLLTGCGSNTLLPPMSEFNPHNSLLNIYALYGIFVLILVIVFIGMKIRKVMKNRNTLLVYCVMDVLMALYIECIFETTLLWVPTVLLWVFQLILLNSEDVSQCEKIR